MFFSLNPFKSIEKPEITRALTQKLYKSFVVLYTAPFNKGRKIKIDSYQGIVQNLSVWYLKLKTYNKTIYIPTSYCYDKIIETNE